MSLPEKAVIFGVLIFLVVAVVLFRRPPGNLLRPADARLGARVFQQNCAVCHGIRGEGRDPAPPLDPTGHADHHPDWELYGFIADGKVGFGQMPAWRERLSDHEIRSVIAYIKTLWTEELRRSHQQLNEIRPQPPEK